MVKIETLTIFNSCLIRKIKALPKRFLTKSWANSREKTTWTKRLKFLNWGLIKGSDRIITLTRIMKQKTLVHLMKDELFSR